LLQSVCFFRDLFLQLFEYKFLLLHRLLRGFRFNVNLTFLKPPALRAFD
jgi:hypothetical protein